MAQAQCSGPIKASMLFRWYNQGAAIAEAGVNASTSTVTLLPQTYNICTWVNQNLSG